MNGYYPPPPYGYNYDPAGFQPSPSPAAQQNKKALRSLSIFAGIGLLGFMLMQQIFSAILMIFGLADLYQNDALFQDAYGILFSIFAWGCRSWRLFSSRSASAGA